MYRVVKRFVLRYRYSRTEIQIKSIIQVRPTPEGLKSKATVEWGDAGVLRMDVSPGSRPTRVRGTTRLKAGEGS